MRNTIGAAVKKCIVLMGVSALVAMAAPAGADTLEGTIGWVGTGVLSFSTGGGVPGTNYIDWCPLNAGGPSGCGTLANGTGALNVGAVTGDFVVDASGMGTIKDMTDNPSSPPYTYVPVGVDINVSNFLDFSGEDWTYTLTHLDTQNCSGPNEVCAGPFKVVSAPNGVVVGMSGIVMVSGTGFDPTPFSMTISTQFTGTTDPQTFIAQAVTASGVFSNSFSGQLSAAAVPEPATLLTFGTGTAIAGALRRRRAKKAKKG